MKPLIYIIFSSIFLLSACNNKILTGNKKLKKRKTAFLMDQLNQNKKKAEWFSAKAAIKFRDDNQRVNLTSYIRMRKDSVIWMNVKKLGVEAARIQITPDSIHVMDRINKKYMAKGFDFIQQEFQMSDVVASSLQFQNLQEVFLGNPIFIPVESMDASVEMDRYQMMGSYQGVESKYQLDGRLYELLLMSFTDDYDGKSVEFQYGDYQMNEESQNYPYFRAIDVFSPQTGNVSMKMQLSKVEINVPKSIKFEIPSRYTKMD